MLAKGQDASFQNKVHSAMQAKGFIGPKNRNRQRLVTDRKSAHSIDRTSEKSMGFKCGIVGLPNVGKSTLFNALTETAAAQAANYPFCTIEPNVGEVAVPDPRLGVLAKLAKSAQIVPTRLTFVDIAGLVRGASKGEGLGNQFLANIREVDAIAHVVRCFEDADVTHVENRIDPVADIETVETELMLADLESLESASTAREEGQGQRQGSRRGASETLDLVNRALALLREGKPARLVERKPEEEKAFHMLGAADLDAGALRLQRRRRRRRPPATSSRARSRRARRRRAPAVVVISAKIEAEIAVLPARGARRISRRRSGSKSRARPPDPRRLCAARSHHLFHRRARRRRAAWTITRGTKAPQAAGVIHTDFERGFIRAETIAYDDYVTLGGESRRARRRQDAARRQGLRGRRRRRHAFPVCDVTLRSRSGDPVYHVETCTH